MRYIISTIGTSILTNMINRTAEGAWYGTLSKSANLNQEELNQDLEAQKAINTLDERARDKLSKNDDETSRRISAELNGIYGIYGGRLPQNSPDLHYLICTDTVQGQITGELIKEFLESRGFQVEIVTPSQLSTKDTKYFAAGTKELIKWLEENVSWQQDSVDHQVIFNLVGGFKSLQGYMQTFGTFYANESVYIFEGSSELIKIPRLPIQIDTTDIENHTLEFAMMSVGEMYPLENFEGIPETLLEPIEDNGKTVAGLSAWGELIWNRTKSGLLTKKLLPFPRLKYTDQFNSDIESINDTERIDLNQTFAKVAFALEKSGGNITQLNDNVSGLDFENFIKHDRGIYRFRITRSIRASCKFENDGLTMIHYGQHQYVDEVSHSSHCNCQHC